MSESTIQISIKRNVALGSLVIIMIVVGVLFYYCFQSSAPKPSPDQIVKIKTGGLPMSIPPELQSTLAAMGITGIAMVDRDRKIRIMGADGSPKDLCGSFAKSGANNESECELATSPQGLVEVMSLNGNCGSCNTGLGFPATCSKTNNRWDCSSQQFGCANTCQ